MKPAAAEARLHVHKGPAIVFDSYEEMKAAVDDSDDSDAFDEGLVA
mgnify:CR=1 FL=1